MANRGPPDGCENPGYWGTLLGGTAIGAALGGTLGGNGGAVIGAVIGTVIGAALGGAFGGTGGAGCRASIIGIGNPGVGKSTILNSLAEEVLFRSGTSFGKGLTFRLDKKSDKTGRIFFDTPGLADRKLRVEAGQAITEALKKGGEYIILFFLRIQSGRVVGEDITTFKLVLDSAPEIENHYGVVINLVSSKMAKKIQDGEHPEHKQAFLTDIFANIDIKRICSFKNIAFLPLIEEVNEEDNKIISVDNLKMIDGRYFKNYVTEELPSVKLTEGNAKAINIADFEKISEEVERLKAERRENENLLKEKLMEIEQAQKQVESAIQEAKEANQARRKAEEAGRWWKIVGGASAGGASGAAVGTAIVPGVGTAIGTVVGGAVGGIVNAIKNK